MKRIAIAPMMLGAALLAACAGAGSTFAHGGTAQTTLGTAAATTSPPARSPIEGTWRSGKLTKAEFLRAYDATGGGTVGSRFETGPSFFGQLGGGARRYAVITLRFKSGYFSELESGDGRPSVVGYTATYRVSGRTLVLVSLRPDPTVCTGIYTFTIRGSQLRLHVRRQCAARHDGPFNTTLFASFPFTKVA
jgi:hypothetical protein